MSPPRIYADTSVYGGALDPEFDRHSLAFFDQVRRGTLRLVASPLVEDELAGAPPQVRSLFGSLVPQLETVPVTAEAEDLQAAYLAAGARAGSAHRRYPRLLRPRHARRRRLVERGERDR